MAYDLRPINDQAITADGNLQAKSFENGFYWNINESSILTKLIQDTGRFAERYASDLFIDWQSVDHYIRNGETENKSWLFGIRESGVDHDSFIYSRMDNNPRTWQYEYRKIYRLDATVTVNEYYDSYDLKLSLYEVD